MVTSNKDKDKLLTKLPWLYLTVLYAYIIHYVGIARYHIVCKRTQNNHLYLKAYS